MAYFLHTFSPETYEIFSRSDRKLSGFSKRWLHAAQRIRPGDKLICYLRELSRWVGVLEVLSDCFIDETPFFYSQNDPFVVRFEVRPVAWLPKEKAVPLREDHVWNTLSYIRGHQKHSSTWAMWAARFRGGPSLLSEVEGKFLEDLIVSQLDGEHTYPVDETEYRKNLRPRIRRGDGAVTVTIPTGADTEQDIPKDDTLVRESIIDHCTFIETFCRV